MISNGDFIRGWNSAGRRLNAEMLSLIFKKLESAEDVTIHNFVMFQVTRRLGPVHLEEFINQVADLIQQISQRNLTDGKEEEKH